MSAWPEIVRAETTHARRGAIRHSFRYRVDFVLIDPDMQCGPVLFSRNAMNLASVADRNHGGPRGSGAGADWARGVLFEAGAPQGVSLRLLAQPRLLGFWFNPVSFWLAFDADDLIAVIAEVSNTFGDRHSYLCAHPDFSRIGPKDRLIARKIFHVSPFQDVSGDYEFAFNVTPDRIVIRIAFNDGENGLIATLSGRRAPMTNRALVGAAFVRPFGPLRTLALIYWNALRLHAKGATYRARPLPPEQEVSR
ncbi:MAG: DUF1365 domain-containing protein [Rhodobiaceae bacterium]|nr:DUF1365 domain-containing protein [Rhodobiaceae bacterium]